MSVQILVTKPGALNQRDRAALRKVGVVCIEADNPADVKLISAEGAEVGASELLYAAIRGANASWDGRMALANGIEAALKLQLEERRKP